MTWRVSTSEKKSIVQIETWKKGELVATKETGWRWGHFDYAEKPNYDFKNRDYDQSINASELGEIADHDLSDGCWEEWDWPDALNDEETEELETAYNEDGEYGLEVLDWELDDTEYYLNGPIDLTYLVENYVKRPIVIQAVPFTLDTVNELRDFCGDALGEITDTEAHIKTLEDGSESQVEHIATVGDYIIKGIKGEFYPCKPDIFEATYEKTWRNYTNTTIINEEK